MSRGKHLTGKDKKHKCLYIKNSFNKKATTLKHPSNFVEKNLNNF